MNTKPELIKLAKQALESLRDDLLEKTASLDQYELAVKTAFDMYNSGSISIERVENTIDELKYKSRDEILAFSNNLDLIKTSSYMNAFSIANDRIERDSMDPETKLLTDLLEIDI